MGNWNNFFLQKMGTDDGGSSYPMYESVATWGVWCKDIPFILINKVKEPAKRSWYDEQGDDEYISPDGLMADSYTMKVEFGCKLIVGTRDTTTYSTQVSDVRVKVGQFLDYLRTSGMLMMYSSYTKTGRQYVRIESVSDNAKWKSRKEWQTINGVRQEVTVEEWLIFEVTFKVNDPVTNIVYTSNGLIVEGDE